MDNPADLLVYQTWRQVRLRAFLSLLEITRTASTNKVRWEEERDNAIGLLEWALTTGLEEVKSSDCPDFPDLVMNMAELIINEVLGVEVEDQSSFAMLQMESIQEIASKNKLELTNYYEPEVKKRLQEIRDARKELDEVVLPAKKQWELNYKNGTIPYQEASDEYLRITTRLDELGDIFTINKERLEEIRNKIEGLNDNFQVSANTKLENVNSVMKNIGNPQINSDHIRKLLAGFSIKSFSWKERAAEETANVPGYARFIVRVFYQIVIIWLRVVLFFKK